MLKPLSIILSLALVTACASSAEEESGAASEVTRTTGRTLVYECDRGDFIARTGPGEIALWVEDRYAVLSQARSGSGARYEEGDMVFWSKGDEATLDLGDERYRACKLNPRRVPWEDARRRMIDFRAIGNEPGWHVEVREGDSLLFVADYGATKFLFRDFTSSHTGGQRVYSAQRDDQHLTVTASESECADSMSGERFPLQVEADLDGRRYQGCGMTLDHPWE
ncbi:MliC family protein [Haliea sp. E17]|uniref:MliC family protein n=1 Tax=Haliea sp. E17 TaxID=3401576 RepID=UPI003AAF5F0B